MSNDGLYNIVVDGATVRLVDQWAEHNAYQPSRRQAVRVLLRQALKAHAKVKAAAAAPAPTATAAA
jgi:hypothetical protein